MEGSPYKLHVYHRGKSVGKDEHGKPTIAASPGHFFVVLQHDNDSKYFGKYPKGDGALDHIYSEEKIKTHEEEELVEELKKLSEATGEDYLTKKTFRLTEEQYNKALKFALGKSTEKKPGEYMLGVSDCTDFVQSVYNAAGLSLYFTVAYSKEDLLKLKSWAALKVFHRYGCRSTMPEQFYCIEALCREELASRLNVDVSRVVKVPTFKYWDLPFQQIGDNIGMMFHVDVNDLLASTETLVESDSNDEPYHFKEMSLELLEIFSENQFTNIEHDDSLIDIHKRAIPKLVKNIPIEFMKLKHLVRFELLHHKEKLEKLLKRNDPTSVTGWAQEQAMAWYEENMKELQWKFKKISDEYKQNPRAYKFEPGETLPGMAYFNKEQMRLNKCLQEKLSGYQADPSPDVELMEIKRKWNQAIKELSASQEFNGRLGDTLKDIEVAKRTINAAIDVYYTKEVDGKIK